LYRYIVAYGALGHALAALNTAEGEPGVDLTARAYLGVMRAQAAVGDVRGVEVIAQRLEDEMAARAVARVAKAAARKAARRDGKPARRRDGAGVGGVGAGVIGTARGVGGSVGGSVGGAVSDASAVAAAAAIGGASPGRHNLGRSGGAAVEAEVVMCEAEAAAAAGDAAGARAALERLKSLDFASSSKVLRDRSTELLVSLFVKDICGSGSGGRQPEEEEKEDLFAAAAPSSGDTSSSEAAEAEALNLAEDECVMDFLNCGPDGPEGSEQAKSTSSQRKSGSSSGGGSGGSWGITQALDLIDSAWGFASLDEDDEFLPSLDEDDIPIPAAGGFGGFLNTAVKRGFTSGGAGSGASSNRNRNGGGGGGGGGGARGASGDDGDDWRSYPAAPTLRSVEAADALELWAGAASRLFAGEAEPLIFRGGVDPSALLREVPDVGMTVDDDEDVDFQYANEDDEYAHDSDAASGKDGDGEECDRVGGGWCSSPLNAREEIRFVVREDEPAAAAAAAVGRDFVAVVIDRDLRPVGTLRGSNDAVVTTVAAGAGAGARAARVGEVMGPAPACVEGDTATVGDVAVICAAAAHNEPVAIVDAAGRLRRVLRQEDLLKPARKPARDVTGGDRDGGDRGSRSSRFGSPRRNNDPR
jgi:hypothetical protein